MADAARRLGTPPPGKRSDARRNEKTLLGAAAAAFVASGVDVPVRDIAAAAGVGVGTIYRRYSEFAIDEATRADHRERQAPLLRRPTRVLEKGGFVVRQE